MKNKIRKCFFGCNTAYGFHSFFDPFAELDDAKILIVKGGPGTGKSTFIRSIAEIMMEKSYNIELQFCSLDCNSLDAVMIPSIKVGVVAGTGHHVLDPRNPGAIDEIINLGSYWDEDAIRLHGKEIVSINKKIDRIFRKVYNYLRAANLIKNNIEDIYSEAQCFSELNKIADDISSEILKEKDNADGIAKERHLFVSSITPDGYINYIDTIIDENTKIYVIVGEYGTGKSTTLNRIADMAKMRGLSVEYYHSPVDYKKIEHLFLPKLNILITSENYISHNNCVVTYNLNDYLNKDLLNNYEVSNEKEKYEEMIHEAIRNLQEAKKLHIELENYYTPHMNFDGVDKCREMVLQKILKHAEKFGNLTKRTPIGGDLK